MVILGLNKFLEFIQIPSHHGNEGTLMQVYMTSGFLKLVGLLELFGGVGLLLNRFVPLALIFLVAIMFNATLFHVSHDLPGVGPAACCLSLSLTVVYWNKERFADILRA